MAGKFRMPGINGICWATDVEFLADARLILVPDVRIKLARQGQDTVINIHIWIITRREGDRFTPAYWHCDLQKQWWVDIVPSTMAPTPGGHRVGARAKLHALMAGPSSTPPVSQVPMPMGAAQSAVEEYACMDDDRAFLEDDLDQGEASDE
jgi:hypothetical protein